MDDKNLHPSHPSTSLQVVMVSPDSQEEFNGVKLLNLTTEDGEMGVMPGHIPMIVMLIKSQIVMSLNNLVEIFEIEEGFAEISTDQVTIIVEKVLRVS
ncbi:F0F1 ATP synthase subunit epsilon [Rickettsiales endosymbiont of Stachyamoeba lipophora]|uniref:F0F1 ATP synthase subunit epsilon n=1 Tax=Rickettsiales endosymbiont of Stachyamoeba lipophora TaxID=2486578 RepID=UPI000F64FEAB|nr:hypothetical protein [Rickettsiales endosymbiont of Stachyamoeba lipophora]AZL15686.1 hypothetical protein EF513_03865 [Rickettsiales endosymbiont of Stachyamoeba lipophora]